MTDDDNTIPLSRRSLMKGSALAAIMAIMGPQAVSVAQAQTTEPRIQLGSDYTIDDDGDELVIGHDTQGDVFRYNPTSDTITALKTVETLNTTTINVGQLGCRGYPSASQSIPSATFTKVEFNSESYDDGDEFDLPNNQFVADRAGNYIISAAITYGESISDGVRCVAQVRKNGSSIINGQFHTGLSSFLTAPLSDVVELQAGDIIELYTLHTDTVSVDIEAGARNTRLSIGKLG